MMVILNGDSVLLLQDCPPPPPQSKAALLLDIRGPAVARLAGHVRVVDVRLRVLELPPLPPAKNAPCHVPLPPKF